MADSTRFAVVESLDNRTVIVRCAALTDTYFSSEAYDDYGPEPDKYERAEDLFPDDEFWQELEYSELEGLSPDTEKMLYGCVTELDHLVAKGEMSAEEAASQRESRERWVAKLRFQALEATWQLTSGTRRHHWISEDSDLLGAVSDIVGLADLKTVRFGIEGHHRHIIINLDAIDYLSLPSHRIHRAELTEAASDLDGVVQGD